MRKERDTCMDVVDLVNLATRYATEANANFARVATDRVAASVRLFLV